MNQPLDRIRVILVEPRGPLNVGAAARAMKNFGLGRLVLVGDHVDPRGAEARRMAVRSDEILEAAEVLPTLDDALAEVTLAVGTTARMRHRRHARGAREAAPEILRAAGRGDVALVFGREDHGLSKEELARCHRVIAIPTSPERMSLNLSQAVMLTAYELFTASDAAAVSAGSDEGNLLDGRQWQRLYDEVLASCEETGYAHAGNRAAIEQSLRRLLRLGPIQTRDARHLFGLVRRMHKIIAGEAEPHRRGGGGLEE